MCVTWVIIHNDHSSNTVGENECILLVLIRDIHFKALRIFINLIVTDCYHNIAISGRRYARVKSPSTRTCKCNLWWMYIGTSRNKAHLFVPPRPQPSLLPSHQRRFSLTAGIYGAIATSPSLHLYRNGWISCSISFLNGVDIDLLVFLKAGHRRNGLLSLLEDPLGLSSPLDVSWH